MYPLLSKGRWALLCLALGAVGYCLCEPFILLLIVRHTSSFSSLPSRTAVLRAGQIGRLAEGVVIESLNSPDLVVRIIACRLLRQQKSKSAVPQLTYLLAAERGLVQQEAISALEAITGRRYSRSDFNEQSQQEAEAILQDVLSPDAFKRKLATERFMKLGLPAVSVLVRYLERSNPNHAPISCGWLLEALARFGYGYSPSVVLPFLKRREPDIRHAAEEALIALGDDVVPYVMPLLAERHYWCFMSAVKVMAKVRPHIAARHLADRLLVKASVSTTRRANHYEALGILRSPEGLYALSVAAEFEDEPRLRLEAVRALAKVDSPGVVPALMRSVRDEDKEVRQAAIQGLYKHGSPEAHRALTDKYLGNELGNSEIETVNDLLSGAGLNAKQEDQ